MDLGWRVSSQFSNDAELDGACAAAMNSRPRCRQAMEGDRGGNRRLADADVPISSDSISDVEHLPSVFTSRRHQPGAAAGDDTRRIGACLLALFPLSSVPQRFNRCSNRARRPRALCSSTATARRAPSGYARRPLRRVRRRSGRFLPVRTLPGGSRMAERISARSSACPSTPARHR